MARSRKKQPGGQGYDGARRPHPIAHESGDLRTHPGARGGQANQDGIRQLLSGQKHQSCATSKIERQTLQLIQKSQRRHVGSCLENVSQEATRVTRWQYGPRDNRTGQKAGDH